MRRPRPLAVGIGLAAALIVAAYANHFGNAFHFDDAHVIEDNLAIRSLANAPRFFTDASTFSTLADHQTYRPLVSLSFAVDYAVAGGLNPVPFHVTQFLLHLFVAIGVGYLAFRGFEAARPGPANPWLAVLAATLFAVHTGNTETVNYLSSRSDILSTLGILGSFAVWLGAPGARRTGLFLVPMVLGALAKPPAVMFAPLILLWIWLFEEDLSLPDVLHPERGDRIWRAFLRATPAFLVGLAAFLFVESMNGPAQDYGGTDRIDYLRTQGWVWLHYARLFVLPVGLTADTDWSLIPSWTDSRVVVGWGFVLLVAAGSVAASRRREWRPVSFGLAWFLLGLLPSSSVFPLAEVANEHRIYLPFVGLVVAAVWGAAAVAGRIAQSTDRDRPRTSPTEGVDRDPSLAPSRAWAAVALVVLLGHAVGTAVRNYDWRTDEALWADVVEKSPGNGRAWMNYGVARMAVGDFEEARRLFQESLARLPNYATAHVNMGIVTSHLTGAADAEPHFLRAIGLEPSYAPGHHFYGRFLVREGRAPEAIEYLRAAAELAPTYDAPRHLLLQIYSVLGATDEVARLAAEIRDHAPGDPVVANLLAGTPEGVASDQAYERGVRLTSAGQHLDAGVAYRAYLSAHPDDVDALLNLGWSQAQLGFDAVAAMTFEQVLARDPDHTLARNNLAWVVERMAARGEAPGGGSA